VIRRALVACALLALAAAPPAFAWGALGHRDIAAIAEANINPRTRQALADLLRAAPALPAPKCRVTSLGDASVWPDCLRGEGDRWQETFAWHYQNAPACAPDFAPHAACPGGACVTAQIARQQGLLANRRLPAGQRLQALAFLAHFIGDVHQPFHTVDNADRGGNTEAIGNLHAEQGFDGEPRAITLHRLWDEQLVRRALVGTPLARRFSPAERAALATGNAEDWARESWRIAVRIAYPQVLGPRLCHAPAPDSVTISGTAIRRDLPIVRQRLLLAGLRLARVLDTALGG